MKNILISVAILLTVNTNLQAKDLIPLEVFAKPATYKNMKISPSGKYMAFTYEEGTEVKLAILNRKTQKPMSGFEFGENRHVTNFTWLNDERISMTVQTIIGWLDGTQAKTHWNVANADGSNRRTIWDHRNRGNLRMIDILKDDPDHVLAVKQSWMDGGKANLYKVNVVKGGKRLSKTSMKYIDDAPPSAAHTEPGIIGYATDLNGKPRFAIEYDRGKEVMIPDDDRLYMHYKDIGSDKWKRLNIPSVRKDRPEFSPLGMSADNTKVYFSSNFDMAEDDTIGAFEFDLTTKKINLVFRHPDVDVLSAVTGQSDQVIGFYHMPGYPTVHYLESDDNMADIKLHKGLSASFPGQFLSVTSSTDDKSQHMLYVRSDRNPGDFYLFDQSKMKIDYIGSAKPEVKPKQMAVVEPFTMVARDGLKMYGYLTLPNGKEQKDLPMVVYPHGGPYGVMDNWRWDRRAQMLASRGYLVLQLNFRGSGGYGKAFQEQAGRSGAQKCRMT